MVKNHKLARSISDAAWGEMFRQLEYKCEWYGRKLVKIDQFFPSSKRCNHCGFVMDKLPLDVRSWDCPSCGTTGIDHDINAGKNILAAGQAVTVCGADIRPDNHTSNSSYSAPYSLIPEKALKITACRFPVLGTNREKPRWRLGSGRLNHKTCERFKRLSS